MKTGRPPKFKSADEMQALIDAYFESCKGEPLMADGQPYLDKQGRPVLINARPPTVTGLALALGFATRKSLLDYQGKAEFVSTITRAKSRVEEYCEGRLFDKDGARGAQFSLACNFRWKNRSEEQDAGETGVIEIGKQSQEPEPPAELVDRALAEAETGHER